VIVAGKYAISESVAVQKHLTRRGGFRGQRMSDGQEDRFTDFVPLEKRLS
jgi:hypothetical protein